MIPKRSADSEEQSQESKKTKMSKHDFSLHIAAKNGDLEMLKDLLENDSDIDVDLKDDDSCTPLHLAIENGHFAIVQELIEYEADVDSRRGGDIYTPLLIAVGKEYVEIVRELLKAGADVLNESENGLTPLHLAVKLRNIEIVQDLLKHGADIEYFEYTFHQTPLIYAIATNVPHSKNLFEVVSHLLLSGANVNSRDKLGQSYTK